MTSNWWFDQTKDLVPNHLIASPHPNITICKKCTVFPVEFVVRGYITGTTSTSMWTNYAKGVRNYCGHLLPEGLQKNQKLSQIMLTPTTKDDTHDELISAEEIVTSGRMSKEDWEICSNYALKLFEYSQQLALTKGLLLVDTKYEFGRDNQTGEILLIDEIQTPDSSRYWLAHSYEERFLNHQVTLSYISCALILFPPFLHSFLFFSSRNLRILTKNSYGNGMLRIVIPITTKFYLNHLWN
jgi:phosphoribosylaminoimidazole-succinocarboxamide synthase